MDVNKQEYDIYAAIKRIEEKLIADIIHSLSTYKPESTTATGTQNWRIEELKRLEQFRLRNQKELQPMFKELNEKIEEIIRSQYADGLNAEEKKILNAVKEGYTSEEINPVVSQRVYDLNERKLSALIQATVSDLEKAEQAVLRRAEDEFRKILFDAQVGLNTGSLTYKQACDMATKDLLANGIQCVKYKNGATHSLSDYCDMAVRTANKRAFMVGEGAERQAHGCHLVIVSKRNLSPNGLPPCKCCLPYIGQVLVDDVYSGGTAEEAERLGYPLLSKAMKDGLFHPRCKDGIISYFKGVTPLPKPLTKVQIEEIEEREKKKQKVSYYNRMAEKYDRMAKHSQDKEEKQKYRAKAQEYNKKAKEWST